MHPADLPEGFWTFYCPLEEETGTDAERLSANSAAWAQKFDLGRGDPNVSALYGVGGAAMITHVFPHATTNPDLAQALADYSSWAFMTDDFIVPDPDATADDLVREVGGALGIAVLSSLLATQHTHHPQPNTLRDRCSIPHQQPPLPSSRRRPR
ncbi:hypothetical protein ACIBVL_29170 [Streptomyces sp. NPDC049687]|uniref:hypothetical protein n=1 Tax=Streptomyces sp. NPDC049687 TaxID=3365596 RepID=UPI003795A5C8